LYAGTWRLRRFDLRAVVNRWGIGRQKHTLNVFGRRLKRDDLRDHFLVLDAPHNVYVLDLEKSRQSQKRRM
jgi:hypothetical protein